MRSEKETGRRTRRRTTAGKEEPETRQGRTDKKRGRQRQTDELLGQGGCRLEAGPCP